jgi:enolase-phosphatase E1
VTVDLASRDVRVVLLDIEGTTTPMAFVHDVLFPFARRHLAAWCRQHAGSDEYRDILTRLTIEHAADRARGEPVPAWEIGSAADHDRSLRAYAIWLMDRDRKSPGLKLLQGLIWEQGYQAGTLRGQVYPDVPAAIRRWRDLGVVTAIYSSGSELAQRRLFASTPQGDLTPLISGFFDTAVGAKQAPESYARIASTLDWAPDRILFVSDVTAELAAASRAGCQTVLAMRPGNAPQPDSGLYPQIRSFDDIG